MKDCITCHGKFTHYHNDHDFILNDTCFERDEYSGRCYELVEPWGFFTQAAKEGGMVRKRITNKRYNECLVVCKVMLKDG